MAKAATEATVQSSNMEPERNNDLRKDYTPDLSRVYRAYDTVARYLTGGAVCAAIVFTEMPGGERDDKYIILSTNKMTEESAEWLDSGKTSNYNPTDPNALNDKEEAEALAKRISKIVEFAGLVNEDPKHLKEKQKLYHEFKKIIGSQYPRNILACFKKDDEHSKKIIKDADLLGDEGKAVFFKLLISKNYYYEFTKYIYDNYERLAGYSAKEGHEFLAQVLPLAKEIYKRINHDATKLVRILDASDEEFTKAIAENKFIYAPPENPWYMEGKNRHDSHGEMNVTKYLVDHKYTGAYYLGISKLSCFHCANDTVINNLYLDGKLAIAVRGEHGVDYSPERVEMYFNHTNYAEVEFVPNEHVSFLRSFFACVLAQKKLWQNM